MTRAEHRAVARIAARQALRTKARTALVLTLIALPVGTLTAATVAIKTAMPSPEERIRGEFGTAELRIDSGGDASTIRSLRRAVPVGSHIAYAHGLSYSTRVDGAPYGINIGEMSVPADQDPVAPRYVLRAGRWPREKGEAVMSRAMLSHFDADAGSIVQIPDLNLAMRVVGEAALREDLRGDLILAGPGTVSSRPDAEIHQIWIDLPAGADIEATREAIRRRTGDVDLATPEGYLFTREEQERIFTGLSFGFTALALFGTGLIAAAAFGVSARRQLRALGAIVATGGEPKHARAVVLWGGVMLGVAGSLCGVMVALAATAIATPHVDGLIGRVVGDMRVSWSILAIAIVLGTLTAALAAFGPARQTGRISAVDALAARTPPPRRPGRIARRGAVAVALGGASIAACAMTRAWILMAPALIVTVGGFLLAIPLLVSSLGGIARWLPTSLRLAARQTARYGRRTGAAVAAATLALTAPITIGTITLSDEAETTKHVELRDDQMVIRASDRGRSFDAVLAAARAAAPRALVAPLVSAATSIRANPKMPVHVRGPMVESRPGQASIVGGPLMVATPELLRAMHFEHATSALLSGRVVALGAPVDGAMVDVEFATDEPVPQAPGVPDDAYATTTKRLPATAVDGPPALYGDLPAYVISETGAARHGLFAGESMGAILRAPGGLSQETIMAVKAAAARFDDAYAQSRADYLPDSGPLRLLVTAIACLIALMIVGVAVALVAAESRREHAIIVAVGADPARRRRITGANAMLTSMLAGLLAIPAGLVPIAIILAAREGDFSIVFPWTVMALVAMGAPVVAGAAGALVSRAPRTMSLLRPIA